MNRLFAFTLFLFSAMSHGDESAEPVFVTNHYPPYAINNGGKAQGLIPEIIETIYGNKPYKIEFMPWRRVKLMVERGEAFAAFPYGKTEERQRKYQFSAPLIDIKPGVFFLASEFPDGFKWSTFDDLVNYQVAGVRGHGTNQILEDKGIVLHRVGSEQLSLKFLMNKRADFSLMDPRVGWSIIKNKLPESAEILQSASSEQFDWTYYLMVSKKYQNSDKHLIYFDSRLQTIKASGEYQRILTRYQDQ